MKKGLDEKTQGFIMEKIYKFDYIKFLNSVGSKII